jgi:hypothetical protein
MGEKLKRRAVYLTTIAAMLAMTGGFVLATTITALTVPPAQGGGFTTTGTPPAGVANSQILIVQAPATAAATTNSLATPMALSAVTTSTTDVVDVNAIATVGDFVQTVTLTFTAAGGAPAATEYAISIQIAGSTTAPQILYIETNSGFASPGVDTVEFQWDLGSGAGGITITSVSDLITQCPSVGVCN